jgi:hypothetical protein
MRMLGPVSELYGAFLVLQIASLRPRTRQMWTSVSCHMEDMSAARWAS